MKWTNVRLIFLRELRDQLRDRRTLFTIAVLPLLLYPLLGMSFFYVSQFLHEKPTRVWFLGADALPDEPALIVCDESEKCVFSSEFCPKSQADLIELSADAPLDAATARKIAQEMAGVAPAGDASSQNGAARRSAARSSPTLSKLAQETMKSGKYDVVVYVPPDFAAKLARFQATLRPGGGESPSSDSDSNPSSPADVDVDAVPTPHIFANSASDKSRMAKLRVDDVLQRWRERIVESNLERSSVPVAATKPFELVTNDVAEDEMRRAAVWSKILPFVVLVWALTGAFYPAVDLCAGEKERGTLETLLSSPAQRSEIVWGKLLTIMTFSMLTSILNMLCMGFTGLFIMQKLGAGGMAATGLNLGPPPLASMGWLVLGLIPISAMFSALTLAIAAFARSTKEGQYYLMPLLLITLPLMMLPMLPAVQMDLGMSLIPVTGMMLLLRSLIEGQYADALRYSVPVVLVTAACCLASIRWAIDQFNNESVLFRESERFGLGTWLRHLVRDRRATPTVSEAVLCGVLVLVLRFFASLMAGQPDSWSELAIATSIMQVALIATPALLMTIVLTRDRRRTLLLSLGHPLAIPMAVLLALSLNPAVHLLSWAVQSLYPLSEGTKLAFQPLEEAIAGAPLWQLLLVMAVIPAVCEELAFRGFILSGMRHIGHKWAAIGLTALMFGVAHGILQQSLTAAATGFVIGYLAVQCGSIWPCIAYHVTNNAAAVLASRLTPETLSQYPALNWLFYFEPATSATGEAAGSLEFQAPLVIVASLLAVAILYWFRRIPFRPSDEERLQTALDRQSVPVTAK